MNWFTHKTNIALIGIVVFTLFYWLSTFLYKRRENILAHKNQLIPLVIILCLFFFGSLYNTGRKYSYLFEILLLIVVTFFALVYSKDKKHKYLFATILALYIITRVGYKYKTTKIETLIKNLNLGEYDQLTYDLLIEKNENVCEIMGTFNTDHDKKLTFEIGENSSDNKKVCKELIKENNLDFVADWENEISVEGDIDENNETECDSEWYTKYYDELFADKPKEQMCTVGLSCNEDNQCKKQVKYLN